jgi:hypothetical protein
MWWFIKFIKITLELAKNLGKNIDENILYL